MLPPRLQGKILPASPSSWEPQVFLGLWPHPSNLCLHLHTASPSVCLCLFCPLRAHLSLDLRPTWVNQDDPISRSLTAAKTSFPDKITPASSTFLLIGEASSDYLQLGARAFKPACGHQLSTHLSWPGASVIPLLPGSAGYLPKSLRHGPAWVQLGGASGGF